MKKFTIQFIILLVLIAGALYVYKSQTVSIPFVPQQAKTEQVIIGDTKVKIEVADTQEKRNKGLGGKETLASDSGMFFIFDREDKYPFWMKGLKFPLDFIWIKGGQVVDITENVPAPLPGQKDADLPIYSSKEPVDRVLEVTGGFIKANNIKIGDTVTVQM